MQNDLVNGILENSTRENIRKQVLSNLELDETTTVANIAPTVDYLGHMTPTPLYTASDIKMPEVDYVGRKQVRDIPTKDKKKALEDLLNGGYLSEKKKKIAEEHYLLALQKRKLDQLSKEIKDKLVDAVHKRLVAHDMGFAEKAVDKYDYAWSDICSDKTIDVTPTKDGDISIEVRAEMGYDGMEKLVDVLNPIVKKYDKHSYFDHEQPGIIVAVIENSEIS